MLTIDAMYVYDNTLLDGISIPSTPKQALTNDQFVAALLMEVGQFTPTYPDIAVMKRNIKTWNILNNPIWKHLAETTSYEYNAIENYDRKEEWLDTDARDHNQNRTATDFTNTTLDIDTATAAFNEFTNLMPESKQNNVGAVDNKSGFVDKFSSNDTTSRTGRAHGNIGVTTTQQMIEEERRVATYNFYRYIIDDFKRNFCIMVY